MKFYICMVLTSLAFFKVAIRDGFRYLFGLISSETFEGNINWINFGATEYINMMYKCKKLHIPCELSISYLQHLYECCYDN